MSRILVVFGRQVVIMVETDTNIISNIFFSLLRLLPSSRFSTVYAIRSSYLSMEQWNFQKNVKIITITSNGLPAPSAPTTTRPELLHECVRTPNVSYALWISPELYNRWDYWCRANSRRADIDDRWRASCTSNGVSDCDKQFTCSNNATKCTPAQAIDLPSSNTENNNKMNVQTRRAHGISDIVRILMTRVIDKCKARAAYIGGDNQWQCVSHTNVVTFSVAHRFCHSHIEFKFPAKNRNVKANMKIAPNGKN